MDQLNSINLRFTYNKKLYQTDWQLLNLNIKNNVIEQNNLDQNWHRFVSQSGKKSLNLSLYSTLYKNDVYKILLIISNQKKAHNFIINLNNNLKMEGYFFISSLCVTPYKTELLSLNINLQSNGGITYDH